MMPNSNLGKKKKILFGILQSVLLWPDKCQHYISFSQNFLVKTPLTTNKQGVPLCAIPRFHFLLISLSFQFSQSLRLCKSLEAENSQMESTISSSLSRSSSSPLLPSPSPRLGSKSQASVSFPNLRHPSFKSRSFLVPYFWRQNKPIRSQSSNHQPGSDGFVLEDVPHLTDFLPNLQVTIRSKFHNFCMLCVLLIKIL